MNQIIGDYQLLETLGQGTFGKVKLGRHQPTGELVAIKILHKNRILTESDKIRVDREIAILRKVRHPNIIQLLEIIETPGHMFIVTQYAQGGELFKHIVSNTRLQQQEASRMIQQILNAVEYLHSLGIAHRDLKPENLLMDSNMNIKVVDFGLGNLYAQGQKLKTACGSPSYAAPEMLSGQLYNGLLTDIWSCGIILYAMCCGYLPFQDSQTLELYRKIKQGKYSLPSFCSDQLRSLLKRILNIVPEMRLSIAKIRQHSFCSNYPVSVVHGMIIGISCIPIQTQIVEDASKLLDVPKSEITNSIKKGKHNSQTSCYYLLLQNYLRNEGKQLLDYFINKQKFIHKYSNIQQTQKLIVLNWEKNVDRSTTTTTHKKSKGSRRYKSIEVDKTEKKYKSAEKKVSSIKKSLLERYQF